MAIPKVWDIVHSFKCECESKGWKISEHEDLVRTDDEYHNFLWSRTVHPATLRKIACEHKCAIRQGVSYKVVDVAYTAWLFSEAPSEELLHTFVEDSELSKRTALYDLSEAGPTKPTCLRLNQTDSKVFREFESFLEQKWGIRFKQMRHLLRAEV